MAPNPTIANFDDRKWLWSVIYARLGDATIADDILQEVYLSVLQKHQSWDEVRQIKGWLYQIAIRHVLQFRRRERRQRFHFQRFAETKCIDGDSCLLDRLCGDEQNALVNTALWQMTTSDRQILLMKYRDELSCREISVHLGVTESTVQTRLLRARRRLRTHLISGECPLRLSDEPNNE